MATHDIFISYATEDKHLADAVCHKLEGDGVRCWIAPRDSVAGRQYGESIINGINECRLMVLILSSNSIRSDFVVAEVERAVSKSKTIVPLRVENVEPAGAIELLLAGRHWLDAIDGPLERSLESRCVQILQILAAIKGEPSEGNGVEDVQPLPLDRRRYRTAAWGGGLMGVALLAGAWWMIKRPHEEPLAAQVQAASKGSHGDSNPTAANADPAPETHSIEVERGLEREAVDRLRRVETQLQEYGVEWPQSAELATIRSTLEAGVDGPRTAGAHAERKRLVAEGTRLERDAIEAVEGFVRSIQRELELTARHVADLHRLMPEQHEIETCDAALSEALRALDGAPNGQRVATARKSLERAAQSLGVWDQLLRNEVAAQRITLSAAVEGAHRARDAAELAVKTRGTQPQQDIFSGWSSELERLNEGTDDLASLRGKVQIAKKLTINFEQICEELPRLKTESVQIPSDEPPETIARVAPLKPATDPSKYSVMLYRETSTNDGEDITARMEAKLREVGFTVDKQNLNGNEEKKRKEFRYVVDKDLYSWLKGRDDKVIVVPLGAPDDLVAVLRTALDDAEPRTGQKYKLIRRPEKCKQTQGSVDLSHHIDIISIKK